MSLSNTRKTLVYYAFLIAVIGILCFFITPIWSDALIGLAIGGISASVNLLLLHLMMKFLMSEKHFLSVQMYVIRMLIYLAGAYASAQYGTAAAACFGASVISISLSIFMVYGIGGIKNNG